MGGRLHRAVAEGLASYYAKQRADYTKSREDWRRDHPLVPGSTWTPESIGLPPRGLLDPPAGSWV